MTPQEENLLEQACSEIMKDLRRASRTQLPEKWEGEKDAWINGYLSACDDNLKMAMDYAKKRLSK